MNEENLSREYKLNFEFFKFKFKGAITFFYKFQKTFTF